MRIVECINTRLSHRRGTSLQTYSSTLPPQQGLGVSQLSNNPLIGLYCNKFYQVLYTEHINIRIIECINTRLSHRRGTSLQIYSSAPPSQRGLGVSQLSNNPLTGLYHNKFVRSESVKLALLGRYLPLVLPPNLPLFSSQSYPQLVVLLLAPLAFLVIKA